LGNATICTVKSCCRPTQARGWCNTHYWRWWKFGEVQESKPTRLALNKKFFDKWSPDMSWLLGLIAADGCVSGFTKKTTTNQAQIAIVSKDRDLIETVRDLLDAGHTIGYADATKYHPNIPGAVHRLDFRSDYVAKRLIALGVRERKSSVGFDVTVPCRYARHFIRGFFDGDGHVTYGRGVKPYRSWGLACSDSSALRTMSTLLQDGAGVSEKRILPSRNIYYLRWSALEDLKRIYAWIYGQGGPCLRRKHTKFTELLEYAKTRSRKIRHATHERKVNS